MAHPVLEASRRERDKAQKQLDSLLDTPTAEQRSLSDDESAKFEELAANIKKLDRNIRKLEKE